MKAKIITLPLNTSIFQSGDIVGHAEHGVGMVYGSETGIAVQFKDEIFVCSKFDLTNLRIIIANEQKKFKKGDKLTHINSGVKHTLIRYSDNYHMFVTEYADELGKGEDWTEVGLCRFKEQILASNIPVQGIPTFQPSFLKKWIKKGCPSEIEVEMYSEMTEGWVPTYNNPDNNGSDPAAEPTGNYIPKLTENNEIICSLEDETETVDYRHQIAEELSKQELVDRLCETHAELVRIKAEWFELKYNTYKPQEPSLDTEAELTKFSEWQDKNMFRSDIKSFGTEGLIEYLKQK